MSRLDPAVDVLDHRFGAGPPLTVGVEEEYMLVEPATLDLAPGVEAFLRAERKGVFADWVAPEIFESLVEFHTPVCASISEVERALRAMREHAVRTAAAERLLLGSAGTHPFSLFERQRVTARERYRALVEQLQYAVRRELIFGLHVHVAVADPDVAIRVVNGLQPHLSELVALSASSPFWRGRPTGFASCRPLIFSSFPRSGPPPLFESYAEYAAVVARLVACGCIEDCTRIWWDVRPHPHFGTVEVRMMDAVSRVEDAVALAAYVQALVASLAEGEPAARVHPALLHENRWQAARHGLCATLIDPDGGEPIAVARLIERTLERLWPRAEALGSCVRLDGVRRILREGNGADRQRAIHAASGGLADVVHDVVAVTAGGRDAASLELR